MKWFFKIIRWPLGQLILFIDWVTRPKKMQRPADLQAEVDSATEKMKLYEYKLCPFCVKTRRAIHRLGLNIEQRDAQYDGPWRTELIEQGGKPQVPCLRIDHDDGTRQWLYESGEIVKLLDDRFGHTKGT